MANARGEGRLLVATIAFVVLLLAYANGANDNFKGVATRVGSGTTSYRRALLWATGTTAPGSVAARSRPASAFRSPRPRLDWRPGRRGSRGVAGRSEHHQVTYSF